MTSPPVGDREKTWPTREAWLADLERQRRDAVAQARIYYNGQQFDEDNAECHAELKRGNYGGQGEKALIRRLFDQYNLPEHLRKHAYSTQISECVDFIADRLAEGFAVEAADTTSDNAASESSRAHEIITAALDATPELSGADDDEQRSITTVLREAAKCGDVPVLIRWDAVSGACWLEMWDSDQVEMRFVDGRPDQLERVIVRQIDWRVVDGESRQVTLRREWSLEGEAGARECIERVWVEYPGDVDEGLEATHRWGVPVIPWWPVRSRLKGLRDTRGASLITDQAMGAADRYNAVEQVSWLIARYNSHGNMVVTGDSALVQGADKPIHKDVADVLTFPGGTSATTITLPTDPAMIEHQRGVLLEALYGTFGLTRVDQETVSNLGAISGYALEILNQRSEVTFARVRTQLTKDLKTLMDRVIDCHLAYSSTQDSLDVDGPLRPIVDDLPQRKITIHLGTGYVVDKALIRDDYLAGLVSQREALRQRGYTDEQIDTIANEQTEERASSSGPDPLGETSPFGASTQAGRVLDNAQRVEPERLNGQQPTGGAL